MRANISQFESLSKNATGNSDVSVFNRFGDVIYEEQDADGYMVRVIEGLNRRGDNICYKIFTDHPDFPDGIWGEGTTDTAIAVARHVVSKRIQEVIQEPDLNGGGDKIFHKSLSQVINDLIRLKAMCGYSRNRFEQRLNEVEARLQNEGEAAILEATKGNPEPLEKFRRNSDKMNTDKWAIQKLLDELNNGINEVAGDLGMSVVS